MIDWSAPSKKVLAAVALSRLCAEKGGMNETMFAEWVLTAKESLWYLQAADWADNPPRDLMDDEQTCTIFQNGMRLVAQIVDLGYDAEHGWWYLPKLWETQLDQQMGILTLMDTGIMLERMKEIPIWPKDVARAYAQPGFLTVSAGFWPFFSLICGPRWRRRFHVFIKASMEAKRITFKEPRKKRRR